MHVEITDNSTLPKYLQIAQAVEKNISIGNLKGDEKMPSINVFSKEYGVSRDTVEKAYKVLKRKKVLVGRKGQGTYVQGEKPMVQNSVLFLVNKLSAYKLNIFNSFIKHLGEKFHVHFEVYHCNEFLFRNLLEKNIGNHNHYVILPHFKAQTGEKSGFSKESVDLIKSIPINKLTILDNNELTVEGNIIEIFQDFENDIYNALNQGLSKIKKYKRIYLVAPMVSNYSYISKIMNGFVRFCEEQCFDFGIMNKISDDSVINDKDLYVVIEDTNLVKLIDLASSKNYVLGEDIGVLSYNETPFKRLLNIAVLSTNFQKMGETAAAMIINNKKGKVQNPFMLLERSSI